MTLENNNLSDSEARALLDSLEFHYHLQEWATEQLITGLLKAGDEVDVNEFRKIYKRTNVDVTKERLSSCELLILTDNKVYITTNEKKIKKACSLFFDNNYLILTMSLSNCRKPVTIKNFFLKYLAKSNDSVKPESLSNNRVILYNDFFKLFSNSFLDENASEKFKEKVEAVL